MSAKLARAQKLAEQISELLDESNDSKLLLTIAEAATELRMTKNTVYKMIAGGELRAVDMATPGAKASRTRVRRDDLEAFIEARTREPRAS